MDVRPSDDVFSSCDWVVDVKQPGSPVEANVHFQPNTPYQISFGTQTYTYFNCTGYNPSTERFFCPNGGDAPAVKRDIFIEVIDNNVSHLYTEALMGKGDLGQYFADAYWMIPHNSNIVCGTDSNCLNNSDTIGMFFTPQLGPNVYSVTNALLGVGLLVRSGKTWDIYGKTLKFQSGQKFNVFGTLDLDNTTLTASGTSWNGLYYGSGSNGSVYFSDILKVGGGTGNSALTLNNSQPSISYSTIETNAGGYVYGVSLTGSGNSPVAHHSNVTARSGPAVYVSGSNNYANLHNDYIDQVSSYPAVQAVGSGRSYFWPGSVPPYVGWNQIRGGRLYALSSGVIDAGSGSSTRSQNHFCNAASSSLEAESGGVVYAKYNYWYNNLDPVQNNHSGSGTIYYSNKLGAASCSGFEVVGKTSGFESEAEDVGDQRLFDARYLISRGSYEEGYALLQAVIGTGSHRDARAALLEVSALYLLMKIEDVKSLAADFASNAGDLQLTGRQVLAGMHLVDGRPDLAREEYERIASSRDFDRRSILDAKVSIASLLISKDEYEEAKQILDALEPAGDDEVAEIALWNEILRIEEENYTAELLLELDRLARLGKTDSTSTDGPEGTSADAYPNPFNPTTTIRYSVPIEGPVTIDVFDALGRRVTTLVRSVQASGTHQVLFDASSLPTGMYLYRIETAAGAVFGKVVLAK